MHAAAWVLLIAMGASPVSAFSDKAAATDKAVPAKTLYNFSLVKPGGAVVSLAEYKGKVVVLVNLASKSSFVEQLGALETLEEKYKDQGLVVIGVPSNDFGAGEPDDDAAIQKFYATQHVQFPVMAKSAVIGKDKLPVYGFLTAAKGKSAGGDVHWNFTKFIVTREGQVGARFEADVAPDSPEFQIAIEKALAGKLKLGGKSAPGAEGDEGGGDDDDGGL